MAGIVKRKPTPAEYIEPGSMLHTHVHPETDSYISAVTRPTGRRSASITDLYVPEEHRQKGIGKMLLNSMMQQFPSLQGQVSSKVAAKNAYAAGRRMAGNENASLDDVYKKIDEDSSVNMWTPKAEGGEVDEPGITAYHGSPHDFERFDMSKIGTGEGAQAYGHGLYFAENPSVAKSYRPVSSENKPVPIIIDGQKFENPTAMQKLVAQHQGNVDAVHKAMSPHWERAASEFQSAPQDPDDLGYMLAEDDHQQALAQKAELEALRGKKIEHDYSGHHEGHALAGHSYEVRINAHPDHFLDWDKPLNEQSEYVQNALAGLHKSGKYVARPQGSPYRPSFEDNPRGRQFLAGLRDALGGSKKEASQNLYAAGIKGVKYLDQGSVNATHKGTRNYVVFDDKLVNVKRKYEKGGIVQGEAPIHALHLTSKFGNSLPSAVNQAKAATRRRP